MQHILDATMDTSMAYQGFYDPALVALSLLAAFLGSFAGLTTIPHLLEHRSRITKVLWLVFGSLALGSGIFAMHFVGMMAYTLPVPVRYDAVVTGVSIIPAILASGLMLYRVSQQLTDRRASWISGAVGGAGVGTMHYVGMLAMRLDANMVFDPLLFLLSVVVAVVLAVLAIDARRLVCRFAMDPDRGMGRLVSPVIMGAAIAGMHYTAMASTWYLPGVMAPVDDQGLLSTIVMGTGLAIIYCVLILLALLGWYIGGDVTGALHRLQKLLLVFQRQHRPLFVQTLGAVLAFGVVCDLVALYIYDTTERIRQEDKGQMELERIVKVAAGGFQSILLDLNMLAGSGHLIDSLKDKDPIARDHLTRQFMLVAGERRVYDQIRFLDAQGMEVVAVQSDRQGNVTASSERELQHRSNQDYFRKAISLVPDALHVAHSGPEVKDGRLVGTREPMIHFATPVFDDRCKRRGVVVLDYPRSTILHYTREVLAESGHDIHLVDQDGSFLLAPQQEPAPGDLCGQPDTFRTRFPAIWNLVRNQDAGSFRTASGLFLSRALTELVRDDLRLKLGPDVNAWKVVLHIRHTGFSLQYFDKDHPVAIAVLICVLLLGIAVAWAISLLLLTQRTIKQAEITALRELEFQKKALDTHAIVSTADASGRITYVNDKFVALSGYTADEMLGQSHSVIQSDQHAPEFYEEIWRTVSSGVPWHGEMQHQGKTGDRYWVRATIVPFPGEDGRPFKYVSIRTDVTAMKTLENSLVTARQVAEDAARAKSEFLANMSHEIRTPMNAIIGLSHLCLQTHMTVKQRDYIRKVHNSATSLLRIINDILDFSKIDAGKLQMESVEFTLEEVLGNISTIVALKAQGKQLEFLMETAPDIPAILIGDPLRLGQILINLSGNAIKFTERGEVAIATTVLEKSSDFIRLQFTVRDTGIGMTPDQVGRLFQAFCQADGSTTRKYGGTGLGLVISQRLIDMMDGHIRVDSVPDIGTRFIFDVRLGIAVQQRPSNRIAPVVDLYGKRVLVVDDNASARTVAADYLHAFTLDVTEVCDGREALRVLQEADRTATPFDLVIMDYMMPELDGITAATMIRHELPLSRRPAVIMATAYGDEEVVKRATGEAGVSGFLVKPISQSLLFEAVMESCGYQREERRKCSRSEQDRGYSKDQRAVRAALAGARLLLVEDNEINQQVARELLEQVNITVLLAENGRQAVDMMATERLDGVLMDLYMPIMDGLTATRRIRSNPRFDRIPIIAMTANAMAGDRDACLEVGMQDHIAKPIDPDEMFATLGRWVTPEHLQATPQTIQPATVPPEPDTDAVPDMAGIDVQAGLRRMGGSPQVYRSILTKFRLNQGESVAAVRAALLSARQGDAERYAHTLKGVAATIGAMALHEQAWELEQQVKSGVTLERLGPCLDRTEAALQQICTVIDGALSGKAVLTPAIPIPLGMETPASIGERDRLFRAVHAQLSSFDAEAGATLESLQQLPLAPEMRTWIDRMAHNVAQYDFEVAMEQLQHVCQLFSIDCRE